MKTCIICDLDGTLAIHQVGRNPRNHIDAESDLVNWDIVSELIHYSESHEIIFLTKRSNIFQHETYKFLRNTCNLQFPFLLIMRDDSDNSDSPTFKQKELEKIKKHYEVIIAIEDDDRNIKMFLENGIAVHNPNERF